MASWGVSDGRVTLGCAKKKEKKERKLPDTQMERHVNRQPEARSVSADGAGGGCKALPVEFCPHGQTREHLHDTVLKHHAQGRRPCICALRCLFPGAACTPTDGMPERAPPAGCPHTQNPRAWGRSLRNKHAGMELQASCKPWTQKPSLRLSLRSFPYRNSQCETVVSV